MQANKAGLLEVADVFVINKADRPGVREARRDLEQMLDLARPGLWRPEIVDTTATAGRGRGRAVGAPSPATAPTCGARASWHARRAERLAQELRRVLLARTEVGVDELVAGEEFTDRGQGAGGGRARPLSGRRPACWHGVSRPGVGSGTVRPWLTTFVTVERRPDNVALIRLDRPKANALSAAVLDQLDAAAAASRDDPPGAVVLWGGRRIFAAGADIVELDGSGAAAVGAQLRRRAGRPGVAFPGPPSPRSTATPSAAGSSWRWPVTSASAPRTPASGCPRCCSA